jgi:hypothetical protein
MAALGAEIVQMGWSFNAVAHATAIEDDSIGTISEFTRTICSSDRLATFVSGQIKYGSLSRSHTNACLAGVIDEVVCGVESISENGRMSMSKVTAGDAKLKQALEQGIEWFVFRAQVAALYPSLPAIVQQAKNLVGQSQREESELQLMLRMNRLASRFSDAEQKVDWSKVIATVSRGNVAKHVDIAALAQYVQYWSGGASGSLLQELLLFSQAHVPAGRVLGSWHFETLSSLKLAPEDLMPHFVTACTKAQLSCPPARVSQRICKFLTTSELSEKRKNANASKRNLHCDAVEKYWPRCHHSPTKSSPS